LAAACGSGPRDRKRSHRPAPLLGQHSREILGQLGYSAREIEALAQGGVVLAG